MNPIQTFCLNCALIQIDASAFASACVLLTLFVCHIFYSTDVFTEKERQVERDCELGMLSAISVTKGCSGLHSISHYTHSGAP